MSQYLLPCSCGANFPVSRSQAGMSLPCPQCGKSIDVPTIRNMVSLPLATTAQSSATNTKSSVWLGLAAAISFLVAAIALYYGGSLAWERYDIRSRMVAQKVDLTMTEEDFFNETRKSTMNASPADTWDYWNALVQEGLNDPNPPDYFKLMRYLESRKPAMVNSFVTAGVSLAIFAALAFLMQRVKKK